MNPFPNIFDTDTMFNIYMKSNKISQVCFNPRISLILSFLFISFLGFSQIPTISSFSPVSGPVGTTVTITGTNFSSTAVNNMVFFGATKATVASATATSLVVTVPSGATFQPISVLVSGLTAYSSKPFVVTFGNNFTINTSSFEAKTDYTTGNDASGIAIADLDGDGKSEVASSNHGAANISVYKNSSTTGGAITLSGRVDYTTGAVPYTLVMADVSGDGFPELGVANYEGDNFMLRRNTNATSGTISFNSATSSFTTANQPRTLAFGDLDKDGLPDAVTANVDVSGITILRSTFAGGSSFFSYATNVDLAAGGSAFSVALDDVDGDGKLDLIVGNGAGTVSVILNTTTGTGSISFATTRTDLTASTSARSVTTGDFDGDGKVDIAVANYTNSVSLFRNTGTTTGVVSFASAVNLSGGAQPVSIATGDLDGDGKLELAVANSGSANVSIFKNNSTSGTFSFAARVDFITGNQPLNVAIGDLNNDGRPDLAVACENTSVTNGIISIFRNTITSAQPTISSFSATSGPAGTLVTVTGTNFSTIASNNIVKFNGTVATVSGTPTSTSLVAIVPSGATTGTITVEVGGLTATSAGNFTVTILPTISSFTPVSGAVGTTVTITGTNFSATAASNTVYFGPVKATVSAATTTSLTVTVPTGATNSPISVNVGSYLAQSRDPFSVTFASSTTGIITSSFAAKVDFATGTGPSSLYEGDFDGDGKIDVIVTNASATTVSIFRNTSSSGTVSFATRVDIATAVAPQAVTVGDFDGDGKLDFAVANQTPNTVSVFRNTSTGSGVISFAARVDFATGTAPIALISGDFDRDGKIDLASANYSASTLSVLRNTSTASGTIGYAAKIDLVTATNPYSVTAADIDGDEKLELICTNYTTGSISIFRNTSTPTSIGFQTKTDFSAGVNPLDVGAADFDSDGKVDLAISANGSNAIVVYRNTSTVGSISLTSGSLAAGSSSTPRGLSIGDFDGDGKVDMACVNGGLNTVGVYRNTSTSGTIAFATKVDFATGTIPYYVFGGDLDGDGKFDLSVINNTANTLSVIRNTIPSAVPPTVTSFTPTSGTPGTSVTITGTNFSTTASSNIVKFNNVTAVVTGTPTATSLVAIVPSVATTGTVSVEVSGLSGTSSGSFTVNPLPTITSFTPTSGAIGTTVTITGTNFSTTVANNQVFFGGVKATVSSATATSLVVTVPNGASSAPVSVVIANTRINSATIFNLTFTNTATGISTASFATKLDVTTASTNSYGVARGDLDGDGKQDLVVTNDTSATVSLYRNTSPGAGQLAFATKVDLVTGTNPWGVVAEDFNNDGKLDIAVANYGSATVSLFINTGTTIGTFSFSTKTDFATGTNPSKLAAGDVDNDGRLDLAVTNITSSSVSILRNSDFTVSAVTLAAKQDFVTGINPYEPSFADLDGDGKLDLVTANYTGNSISVFRNLTANAGSISFTAKTDYTAGSGPWAVHTSDIDEDGKMDIIVGNNTSGTISVFRNASTATGTIALATKVDLTSGAAPRSVIADDFDGDGLYDIATANYSASTLSVFRNTSTSGTIALSAKVDFTTSTAPFGLVAADMDADGKPDLVSANYSALPVSVIRNAVISPTYAQYTFSGGDANDDSGNGFNGTASTGVLFSTDRFGYGSSSFEPENNGDHIQINHNGRWNLNGAVIIAAWIRPNTLPTGSEFWDVIVDGGGFGQFSVQTNGELLYHWLPNGTSTNLTVRTRPEAIDAKQWSHVLLRINAANELALFVNGESQEIALESGSFALSQLISRANNTSTIAYIGNNSTAVTDNRWFDGSIDDVRVYTGTSLTDQEILDIYESEKPEDQRINFEFASGVLTSNNGYGYSGNYRNAGGTTITPLTTTDRFGNAQGAMLFDNTGNELHVSHERSLNLRNDVTVNMWVNPTALPATGSFGDVLLNDNAGGRLVIFPNGGLAYHYPASGGTSFPTLSTPTGVMSANTWKMVSMSISEDNILKIYVNGQLQALTKDGTSNNGSISDYTGYGNPDRFILANADVAGADNRFFDGALDDVSVYQKALLDDEIALLYTQEDARLRAYFKFDGDALDHSGRGFNGTVSGAVLAADRFGDANQSYSFDGVDDKITNSSLTIGSSAVTFSSWINFKASNVNGFHTILEFGDDSPILSVLGGKLDLFGGLSSDEDIPTGRWTHIAASYGSNTLKLFIDGTLVKTSTANISLIGVGLGIGQNSGDIPFEGEIDEVRIYSVALSDAEIQEIHLLESQTFTPPVAPTNLAALVSGPNSIYLTWEDRNLDETNYLVEVFQAGSLIDSGDLGADSEGAIATELTTGLLHTFDISVTNQYGSATSTVTATPVLLNTPIVEVTPANFALNDQITITYYPDRSYPTGQLTNASKVYLHSGLVTSGNENGAWDLSTVVGNWGLDDGVGLMTNNGNGSWSITFTPTNYYGVDMSYDIAQIGMVFRDEIGVNVGKGVDLTDLYLDVFNPNNLQKPVSESITFDGDISTYLVANSTDPGISTAWSSVTNFTLESWVNLVSFPGLGGESEVIARWRDYDTEPYIAYRLIFFTPSDGSETELRADISNGNVGSYEFASYKLTSAFLGSDHHIAASYNGSYIRLFIDGILVAEQISSVVLPTTEGPDESIFVGYTLNGELDEVRLWNIARTTTQIRQTIEETITNTSVSGLRGYWPLDVVLTNGSEQYTPDGTTNINDLYLRGNVQVNGLSDLSATISSQASQYTIGNAASIEVTLTNNSAEVAALATGMVSKLYLSSNGTYEPSDLELASTSLNIDLAASSSQNQTVNFTVPSTVTEGTYFFIVRVDETNIVEESDELNNSAVGTAVTMSNLPPLSAPGSLVATNVTLQGFTLSWNSVTDADRYEYSVSSNDTFTSIIVGPTTITNTTVAITGLDLNRACFYRVKAEDTSTSRESAYATGNVTTLADTEAPTVTFASLNSRSIPQTINITINTTDNVGASAVEFYRRGALATSEEMTTLSASTISSSQQFQATILSSDFDDLGVSFYAIAFDESGNESTPTEIKTITRDIPTAEIQTISGVETGSTVQDYQILALPYVSAPVSSVIGLDEDPEVWRLSTWNPSSSSYNYSINTFSPGVGYWLIINDPSKSSLNFSNVSPVAVDEVFDITLRSGWNQIGNPFLQTLDWSEVRQHNIDQGIITSTELTQLFVYENGYVTTTSLSPYEGAFVEATGTVNLEIPLTALTANRISADRAKPRQLITQNGGWEMVLDFQMPDDLRYGIAGFGQFPEAEDQLDYLDLNTPILFDQFVKAEFIDDNNLARSIHKSKQNDSWAMAISSSYKEGTPIQMVMNGIPTLQFGESLVMLDISTGDVITLEDEGTLKLKYRHGMLVKFIKGDANFIEAEVFSSLISVSNPFPNPTNGKFHLTINKPDMFSELSMTAVRLIDLSGKEAWKTERELNTGYNELIFNLESVDLKDGIYFIELGLGERKITKKVYLKREE